MQTQRLIPPTARKEAESFQSQTAFQKLGLYTQINILNRNTSLEWWSRFHIPSVKLPICPTSLPKLIACLQNNGAAWIRFPEKSRNSKWLSLGTNNGELREDLSYHPKSFYTLLWELGGSATLKRGRQKKLEGGIKRKSHFNSWFHHKADKDHFCYRRDHKNQQLCPTYWKWNPLKSSPKKQMKKKLQKSYVKKPVLRLVMVEHACNSSTWSLRQENHSKFEADLGYTVSSQPAELHSNILSKNNTHTPRSQGYVSAVANNEIIYLYFQIILTPTPLSLGLPSPSLSSFSSSLNLFWEVSYYLFWFYVSYTTHLGQMRAIMKCDFWCSCFGKQF